MAPPTSRLLAPQPASGSCGRRPGCSSPIPGWRSRSRAGPGELTLPSLQREGPASAPRPARRCPRFPKAQARSKARSEQARCNQPAQALVNAEDRAPSAPSGVPRSGDRAAGMAAAPPLRGQTAPGPGAPGWPEAAPLSPAPRGSSARHRPSAQLPGNAGAPAQRADRAVPAATAGSDGGGVVCEGTGGVRGRGV